MYSANAAIFQLYHGGNELIFNEKMMRSSLTLFQTNTLSWILQWQLTETIFRGQTCRSTQTHYSDSEPASICSYSLMLRAQRRRSKYQFYNLWIDPTWARTHESTALEASTLTITPPMRSTIYMIIIRYMSCTPFECIVYNIPSFKFSDHVTACILGLKFRS